MSDDPKHPTPEELPPGYDPAKERLPKRAAPRPIEGPLPPPPKPPKRGSQAWFTMKRAERRAREEMRQVVAELERAGVTARVLAAHDKIKSPFFDRLMNTAIKEREAQEKLTRLDPVRAMAMRILGEDFGLDLEGVDVSVRWDPQTRKCGFRAQPSAPAMAAAARAVRKPKEAPTE